MRGWDRKFVFLLAFIILGIALSIQFRSTLYNNSKNTSVIKRIEYYNAQLTAEKKKIEEIKKSIIKNQEKKDELLKTFSAMKIDKTRTLLGKELFDARFKAGLTDVKGRGVLIVMDDAPARQVENPNELIIHDSDVWRIINILKAAGAQAISMNGERLISTSEQICNGPTIRINKNRYAVPFEIKAIGDPDLLESGINNDPYIADMRGSNIKIEIKKYDEILIPRYSYSLDDQLSGMEVKLK
jgi:uncharacterized protein YlxW (UPF0749 family)